MDSLSSCAVPSLQDLASRALCGVQEHSPLLAKLRLLPPSELSRLASSVAELECVRELLSCYWLNSTGLCLSWDSSKACYRLHHLAKAQYGIVIEQSGCPGDAKLGTLLRLVRDAERRHFQALGQPEQLPIKATETLSLPYRADPSSQGYTVSVGQLSASCPVRELIPKLAEQLAQEYLGQLKQELGLGEHWTLSFLGPSSIDLVHEDAP